jgi:uncharacterized protein YndB with AHSA1/START domain
MTEPTNRIEKSILLPAPCARVWQAISDTQQFGTWFGVEFDGGFVAGARLTGKIVPTKVDPEVAKSQAPHAGKSFECFVDRIEPMRRFSFRWHPFAVDPGIDYASEPMTLVVFDLTPTPTGTMLTISETGFDRVPASRRAQAHAAHEQGWEGQTRLIAKYLAREA